MVPPAMPSASSHVDLSLLSLGGDESGEALTAPAAISAVSESQRTALQRWVLSLALVNFDLELGPDVEFMYPPLGISKEEKDNIAFSSFPDTAVFSDGSLVFSWRVREVPLEESHATPPQIPDAAKPARHGSVRTPQRDRRSGTTLLTRHASLRSAGRAARNLLQRGQAEAPPHTLASSRSTSYIHGYTFFRQKRDPALRRGYFQKSLVILTHLPHVALFSELAAQLGPLFFEHGLPVLESFVREVTAWPDPDPGATLALPYLGQVLHVSLPHGNEAQNGDWAQTAAHTNQTWPLPASMPQTPLLTVFRSLIPSLWLIWECMLLAEPILVVGRDPRTTSEAVWHMVDLIRPVLCAGDFRPYFHIHDYDFKALATRNKPQAGTVLGVTNPFFLQTCLHWPHMLRLDSGPHGNAAAGAGAQGSPSVPRQAGLPAVGFVSQRKRHVSKDRVLLREMQALAARPSEHAHASAVLRRYFADLTERFLAPLNRYMASLIPADFDLSSPAETPRVRPFHRADFLASLKTHSTPLRMRQRSLSTTNTLRHALYNDFLQCPNFSLWLQARIAAAEEEQWQRRVAALALGDVESFGRTRTEIETVDLYVRLVEELRTIDRALRRPAVRGPGQRWRTTEEYEPATGHSTPRTLETQRVRLQAQLDKLCAAMPADLRAGLSAKRDTP